MRQLTGQPISILKKGSIRRVGRDARRNNIAAAKSIAELVKNTLGPRGMNKLIVNKYNQIIISSNGATILDEVTVHHPIGKIMVDIAKAVNTTIGDGTKTAVILTAETLKNAEKLLEEKIHPTVIIRGLKIAMQHSMKTLDEIAETVNVEDQEVMKYIAMTCMNGKAIESGKKHLAEIVVEVVKHVIDSKTINPFINFDDIQFVKKKGESLRDTEFIPGIIVDRKVASSQMPKIVRNAKIALIKYPIERSIARQRPGYGTMVKINDPQKVKAFINAEMDLVRKLIDKIDNVTANVVMCGSRIDEKAQELLSEKQIMAVQKVRDTIMEKLYKATGGKIIKNPLDIVESDLGASGFVEERKTGKDRDVFVYQCKDPKAVSILVRAGDERVADEAERILKNALSAISNIFKKNKIVSGGGSTEFELARRLRNYARKIGGKEQLGVIAFADALETIPKQLAFNAGFKPSDIIVKLARAHETKDGNRCGVDLFTGEIKNMLKERVMEPLLIKEVSIKTAIESASMILRADELIISSKS